MEAGASGPSSRHAPCYRASAHFQERIMPLSTHREPAGPPDGPDDPVWPGEPKPEDPTPDPDRPPYDPDRVPGTPQGPDPASPDSIDLA